MRTKVTAMSGTKGHLRTLVALAASLMALLVAALAPTAGADETSGLDAGVPAIGYWTDTNAVVADAEGQILGTFPNFEWFSLNGPVLAGELTGKRGRRIVAYDIASRERLLRIREARHPVVTAGGKRIAFLPTTARDDNGTSVWMRMGTGRIRRLARFSNGPGLPGIRHGMRAGAAPLYFAFDEGGRTMALTGGNENIRTYDVWLVDVKTKEVTRVTRSNRAYSPSLSPDGSRLSVMVDRTETCFSDVYGEYFIGNVRLFSTVTDERTTLVRSTCDLAYGPPARWIDDGSLLMSRATRDETEEFGFDLDLVKIDADSGEITEVLTAGNPCCFDVSASLGLVGYVFSDRGGFGVLDLVSGAVLDNPEGNYFSHVSGSNRL